MAFEADDCQRCGGEFEPFEDANAAQSRCCSPCCEVDGKDL